MARIEGGCLCGSVRYTSNAQPVLVAVCHCKTCQKNTGSAFSLNLAMPTESLQITGDTLVTYEDRAGASGNPFYRSFCSHCGSPISGRGAAYAGLTFVKAGTLDDPSWVTPGAHIWCSEKQPWAEIGANVAQHPRNPGWRALPKNPQSSQEVIVLTTLCIISLDQGKIAPRYDIEPKSPEEVPETAACKMEQPNWQIRQTSLAIWKGISAKFGYRQAGKVSHAWSPGW
jgi:hypothetical protein